MIQRIQSFYLLVALLLSAALFMVPMYSMETLAALNSSVTSGFRYFTVLSNPVYLILNTVSGIMALAIIFLFKNRNLQVRLCNLNMFVICIFTGTIFYFADHSDMNAGTIVHYSWGCYFPLVQLALIFLAIRAIRKDEALVRSADRLR